ncbi:MAG: DUF1549 domain-containing protein [Rubripirellula sp.]|nr:DUF1549 domain-containing protein [Rubripirellula sp.]
MPACKNLIIFVAITAGGFRYGDELLAQRVDYGNDIALILSRHCFECHGPDADERQADLRLDSQASATSPAESGFTAITPGESGTSELIKRVKSNGGDRMPPAESGSRLSAGEIKQLERWIDEGATWERHWSFNKIVRRSPPIVRNQDWGRNPIDRFVLAKLEREGLTPVARAKPSVLVRRVYYDLLGLPPTPHEVTQFLNDQEPGAWERLIDRLLASPMYGQRWGRHWLDVARYGDSNGGDENHLYPYAWRYRDYVISSFNDDLPFDQFVNEQIAGDLIDAQSTHGRRRNDRLTATGFLALGTKILAERDEIKKQADMVDEQIDTLGKAFLAFSLGCARCHDHKFDPIPTRDYYALAGIFHSTKLEDQVIQTDADRQENAAYEEKLEGLYQLRVRLRADVEAQIASAADDIPQWEAERFSAGNVTSLHDGYGQGIGIISDRGPQSSFAEYEIDIPADGPYLLQVRYAARDARPGEIRLNGAIVKENAIANTTGGWMPEHQQWFSECTVVLKVGANKLRIESEPLMSHIDKFRLIQVTNFASVIEKLEQLARLNREIIELQNNRPKPSYVMAVTEGTSRDVQIHIRGSHLQLGKPVARGFPTSLSSTWDRPNETKLRSSIIPPAESGRLQLASWMTDAGAGAGGQTSRVIVNRLWHWHFGEGIVRTTNDFGLQGARPTHPELLDWMASELIRHDWSLKFLHRMIVTSATYQQGQSEHPRHLFRGLARRRLEAEAIRDSLLMHGGSLVVDVVGDLLGVKSQDPSPADLHANEAAYRDFPRRSVHLPIIRCNTNRFLVLYDFPNATTPVGSRDNTTVPTQALLLMNDPFVVQQAQDFARRILRQFDHEQSRVEAIYQQLFQRSATSAEREALLEFRSEFGKLSSGGDIAEQAVWGAMIHSLFLSSEFIHVD